MTHMTQKQEVLLYMKTHRYITTLDASTKLFVMDLQSIIRHLKKEYNISYKWIYKTNMYGRPIRYLRYRFSKPTDIFEGYTPYRRAK